MKRFLSVVIYEYGVHRSVGTAAGLTLVLGLLVAVAAVGGVGLATEPVAAQSTNETTIQHENPESVAQEGDSERVRAWLSGRLTDRLRENSIRISQGQYERADDVFDDEFEQRLGQYVDVAGESGGRATSGDGGGEGGDTDDQTLFERAQSEQTRLAALRAEYDETYTAYLEARQRGDSAAARQHARRLQQLAREIRALGGSVTRTLESIENETGANTEDIQQRVNRTVQNVTRLQEEVQTETFVETELTIRTNRTVASFVTPVRVRGRLVIENGTAVANRSIRIQVGQRAVDTTTGPNGTFAVVYRPTLVRVDAEAVPVRYQPDPTSPYLATTTNASLEIEQIDPSLELAITPKSARFGERFTVEAMLSVDGRAVPGVPIGTTLSGSAVGKTTTGTEGTARVEGTVPAGIPPANATVDAVIIPENRAIGPAIASTDLVVRESPTDLSTSARIRSDEIVVEGTLAGVPDDGDTVAVPSQPVVVTVGDITRTVRTDDDGQYEATVAVTAVTESEAEAPVLIRAQFDGSGTNLESASAQTRLNASVIAASAQTRFNASMIGDSSGQAGSGSTTDAIVSGWAGLGGIVVVVLAAGGFAWWWRQRDAEVDETTIGDESGALTEESASMTDPPERTPLAEARDALSAGDTDQAVIAAYGAVRRTLTERYDSGQTQTPREFLATCEERLDPEASTALHTLTEMYEQTVFAPGDIEAPSQAVDAAHSLLETATSERGEVADD